MIHFFLKLYVLNKGILLLFVIIIIILTCNTCLQSPGLRYAHSSCGRAAARAQRAPSDMCAAIAASSASTGCVASVRRATTVNSCTSTI